MYLGHGTHVPVAGAAALGAEDLDVAHVRKPHEAGQCVDAYPLGWLLADPRLAHLLDLRLMRRCRAGDHLVAAEARLERRDPRLARNRHRAVAVQAGNLVLTGVNVVAKEDRLPGTGEFPRVANDGSRVGRRSLPVLRRGGAGNEESDCEAGRGPTTPLRHQSRSMANVSCVCGTACGRQNVAPPADRAQAPPPRAGGVAIWSRPELNFQPGHPPQSV